MRINRPASLFVSIALLASVVVGYSTTASAAPATPPAQAIGYWTESAMASAQPIEVVVDSKTGQGRLRVIEQGKVTSGTSSTQKAFDWPNTEAIAQTAVGKVFFSVGRSNYVCSGALVNDNGKSDRAIVLTAGHCVWNQGIRGSWVSNWAFVPNYDGGSRIKWYSNELIARSEFTSQKSFNNTALAYDWAFAVLRTDVINGYSLPDKNYQFGSSTILDNSYPLKTSGFEVGSTSFAFGYPAAAPYDGQSLKYVSGSVFLDPNTPSTTWGMISDLTGGASGGPWLSGLSNGVSDNPSGTLSSVNSYKYSIDATKMYGPRFTASTQKTFEAALSSSGGNKAVNN